MKGKSRIKRTSSFFVPIFVFLTKGGTCKTKVETRFIQLYSVQPVKIN